MPVKRGDRRGRYAKTRAPVVDDEPEKPTALIIPGSLLPTAEDLEWLTRIIADSRMTNVDAKTAIAESCLTLRLLLRNLRSGRVLTAEEEGMAGGAAKKLGDEFERLGLTDLARAAKDKI